MDNQAPTQHSHYHSGLPDHIFQHIHGIHATGGDGRKFRRKYSLGIEFSFLGGAFSFVLGVHNVNFAKSQNEMAPPIWAQLRF